MFRFLEEKWEWSALPLRLALGALFVYSGINKLLGIDGVTGMLQGIGFPAPEVFAWILASLEVAGGLLLILGLLTRLSAIVLSVILLVAIILVQAPNVGMQLFKDLGLLGGLISLLLQGPGKPSLDQVFFWE